MLYELFHKNTKVLTVDYSSATNTFGKIIKIHSKEHLPIGFEQLKNKNNINALQFWWESRLIPKNRHNLSIPRTELTKIISDSCGFCLSDQYWIKPQDSPMSWGKGNYFNNTFNEDIGKYISGKKNKSTDKIGSNTPDLFSNGEQDKRWVVNRGKRILLKYGKPPYYEQPFNEMLATEICRRLKFNHVKYSFISKEDLNPIIYSSCECFIDENTEYIPAGFIQYALEKNKNTSSYDHLIDCCEFFKMPNMEEIKKHLAQMIFLDYVMGNTDRHFGNFGFIRNAETLEWKGSAPLFDTGNSMFFEYPTSDLQRSSALMENVPSKTFSKTQKAQLRKFATEVLNLNIDFDKLKNIDTYYKEILLKNSKVDAERRNLLCKILLQRINDAKQIIYSRNNITKEFLSSISEKDIHTDFYKHLALCRQNMIEKSQKNKEIIDTYLKNLKASSPKELETKIKQDIVGFKIPQSTTPSNSTT